MGVRLASFIYEGTQYFVCLDGGFLQNAFPGRNAVALEEVYNNPGYSAAIAQPWGKPRPMMCPVSEDAMIRKDGDLFIVSGTCGGYMFGLTRETYEIVDVDEEKSKAQEDTQAVAELTEEVQQLSAVVEETEEVETQSDEHDESVADDTEAVVDSVEQGLDDNEELSTNDNDWDEYTPIEEPQQEENKAVESLVESLSDVDGNEDVPVVGEVNAEDISMINQHANGFKRPTGDDFEDWGDGVEELEPEPESAEVEEESVAFDDINRSNKFIGRSTGGFFQLSGTLHQVNRTPTGIIEQAQQRKVNTFRGMKLGSRKSVVKQNSKYLDQDVATPKGQREDEEALVRKAAEERVSDPVVEVPTEEAPKAPRKLTDMFQSTPKSSNSDFDAAEFMSQLTDEQRSILEKIPDDLLGKISEFSQKPVDMDKLKSLGAVYCVQQKWHICGDWYAIDSIPDLCRYFFFTDEDLVLTIPTKVLRGWLQCKEMSLVG